MRRCSTFFVYFLCVLPSVALAHGETTKTETHHVAPDLHPIIVLGEFGIVMVLGYVIAGWLTWIGKKGGREEKNN